MALTYGFYNSVEGDRTYDAIQMGQIFDGIITDGVYATFLKAMVVKASENASEVIVQPGRCWFNHTWTYIDADYPVEAPLPEVILDRVDALVLDINSENAFRANSLVWVQGTPSSLNPERPSLIKSVTHNQYPLCYVYRKAGTTMIYAADITNAVGTSETPFVTGVLTGINIDDLLSQWDDEFHTWEAATKTSFEAWMVNQQSVYVTWFDSIKDQMEGDLTDFETWFETIRGIIDEEAATHLQAEIDEIKDMLPAGSHIDISTSESTLFNRNVTVSDGVHSKTVQFDSIGGATVESFPYIGIISVTSTDGTRTAEESINIPYFGRYSAVLAFWSATVNLVGDETLAALPVTVRDSNGDVIAVVTLNASGQGVFTATKPDTYKFIYTYGGQTMEVSLAVTQETTYEVEIHGGFNYQAWLLAGRVSETFDTLDEILADEPTLRQLFLVHDSVDYICNTLAAGSLTDTTKIFNTDLAAKWINLSDYALDHFYAVEGIKSIMDTADKYGYGEWALMPQVPKMTSNTAPFGEASDTQSYANNPAWYAFDGNETTFAVLRTGASDVNYLRYHFVSPTLIKKCSFKTANSSATKLIATTVSLQGSNDAVNWVTLGTTTTVDTSSPTEADMMKWYDINADSNNTEYEYIQIVFDGAPALINSTPYNYMYTCQFYAWAPKGNVPVMTNDTAPYGSVIGSSATSGKERYKAFNGEVPDTGSNCYETNTVPSSTYIGYKFVNPVCVRKVSYVSPFGYQSGAFGMKTFVVKGSNDGSNWETLTDTINVVSQSTAEPTIANIDNDDYYLYYALFALDNWGTAKNYTQAGEIQFYGRELKVSVPTMTSNTAPFGEVIQPSGSPVSGYEAWKAFDGNASGSPFQYPDWHNNSIGYKFTSQTCIKMVALQYENLSFALTEAQIVGNNDALIDTISPSVSTSLQCFAIDNDKPYTEYKFKPTKSSTQSVNSIFRMASLQFYGLDYSEKEFEAGATKKWLYDHGLVLGNQQIASSGYSMSGYTMSYAINGSDELILDGPGTGSIIKYFAFTNSEDLSNYDYIFVKRNKTAGDKFRVYVQTTKTAEPTASYSDVSSGDKGLAALSISSFNQTGYPIYALYNAASSVYAEVKELWLE